MSSDTETTKPSERIVENIVEQAYDRVREALDKADAIVLDGIYALRPLVRDDDTFKLSDVLEDMRHDLGAARRRAERVQRDHARRATR